MTDMTLKAQRLLREALNLPPKARADIAGTLLGSLDQGEDPGVESAWEAEVERRIHDVDSGRVKLVPWAQVRRRLRTTLRRGRAKA
jgi:putative addiction module component (TIGR02574 family)